MRGHSFRSAQFIDVSTYSRTIASFTLGWVFLLACRHVAHAPLTHTLGRALCLIFLPSHHRLEDVESTNKPLSLMHMNIADAASGHDTRDGSAGQRLLAFLLYWALVVSSMTQFLSLLVFGNGLEYQSLCGACATSSLQHRSLLIIDISRNTRSRHCFFRGRSCLRHPDPQSRASASIQCHDLRAFRVLVSPPQCSWRDRRHHILQSWSSNVRASSLKCKEMRLTEPSVSCPTLATRPSA